MNTFIPDAIRNAVTLLTDDDVEQQRCRLCGQTTTLRLIVSTDLGPLGSLPTCGDCIRALDEDDA